MQLHIWVRYQVAVLLKVVGNADHVIMPFDHEAVEVRHIQAQMEVILRLEGFQLVMGFQQMFDGGLKECFHGLSKKEEDLLFYALRIGVSDLCSAIHEVH